MTLDEWKSIRSEKWRHQHVSKLAEKIWNDWGRPSGKDVEIWKTAEWQFYLSDEANAHHGPGGDW